MTRFWQGYMWLMKSLARPLAAIEGWLTTKRMRAHGRYLDAKRRKEEPEWLRKQRNDR